MSISDELRELSSKAGIYSNSCRKLRKLADRIDAEMVELPKDRDGVPIHVGDTVYTSCAPSRRNRNKRIQYVRYYDED